QQLEGAAAEADALTVGDRVYPLARDRQQLPVQTAEAFLSVYRLRAGDEPGGADHVRRAACGQQCPRVGQLTHERARTTGASEVHVRQQQIVDGVAADAELIERVEQIGNGGVRSHIDERRAPGVDDEVCGGVTRIEVLGVHRGDAVRVPIECRLHHGSVRLHVHIVPCRLEPPYEISLDA